MSEQYEKIEALWDWFRENEDFIKAAIETESSQNQQFISNQLNNFVLDLGMFTWEIGLNDFNKWFFTISPNGDKELLVLSKQIIEEAPAYANWDFNYAKPPKKWDRVLTVYDSNMDLLQLDTSNWHYVVLEDELGNMELILEADNIGSLDEDTVVITAELIVVNEIGEENKIKHISSLSITDELEDKLSDNKVPIAKLKFHIESII